MDTDDYTTDAQHVYFEGKPLPGSDPATFTRVDEAHLGVPHVAHYFAFDSGQLYADAGSREGVQLWTDAEIASLQFFPGLADDFFADRYHLFHFNGHFIEYVPPANHPAITAELRSRAPEADAWWNWRDDLYRALQPVSETYYTDGERVFHFFDAEALRPDGPLFYNYPFAFGYSHDRSYFSVLPGVSPDDFEPLNAYYARSSRGVHHLARPIDADPASFRTIDGHLGVDRDGTWYGGYRCKDRIDPDSFEIVKPPSGAWPYLLAKDARRLYTTRNSVRLGTYQGYSELLVALPNSDPAGLKVAGQAWASDRNNVYCFGEVWKNADAASFEFLVEDLSRAHLVLDRGDVRWVEHSYAKDAHHLYNAVTRKPVRGVDGAGFVKLNEFWGKDDQVVYSFKSDRIVKELDAASFRVLDDDGTAEDRNHSVRFVPGQDGEHDVLELQIT